jgi:hypothetical protein
MPYQAGPGAPGPRRGRTLAAAAAAVLVAIAVTAFAVLHHGTGNTSANASKAGNTAQQSPTQPASGGASSGSSTPASPSPSASSGTVPPVLNPAGTVTAYYTAINNHHYRRAWNLGGRHTASSFSTFKQGYRTTQHDTLVVTSTSGSTVQGRLTAAQTDGTVKTYQGTYTVQNGAITSFNVRQIG